MDCRKFHKNLEDYLEGGLDFPGRFGMERHAQQCIRCGKELTGAQRLRQMVSGIDRVKAPVNFEQSLLNEIGKIKTEERFSSLKRFWIYGFEWPSMRKVALASSCLAILAFGMFYFSANKSTSVSPLPVSAPPVVAVQKPVKTDQPPVQAPEAVPLKTAVLKPTSALSRHESGTEEMTKAPDPERERIVEEELAETDYVELQLMGPDNRPVSVYRQPNEPQLRNVKINEEYFLRNLSH